MRALRQIQVSLDMATRTVSVRAVDEVTRVWMARVDVAATVRASLKSLGHVRIAPAPPAWAKPLEDVVSPEQIAARLEHELRWQFPTSQISVKACAVAPHAASG